MNSGCRYDDWEQKEWACWLEQHGPAWLLFARQQSRCEADAHDLVQEAVVEAWQRCTEGALPSVTLVFATIRRRAVDWARSQNRRRLREEAVQNEAAICWFDSTPEDRERNQLIQDAMRKLPDVYREVVTLKTWGDLTFAQIAEALDIPANTAASRYRYGLDELRRLMGRGTAAETLGRAE